VDECNPLPRETLRILLEAESSLEISVAPSTISFLRCRLSDFCTSRNSSTSYQWLTLVHFSAQPKPFRSRLPVSPCLIDWGKIVHPTYLTKCGQTSSCPPVL